MQNIVEVNSVIKKFVDTKVLDDISLSIELGDKIAMMGPNGAGKTTLIRAILGFYHIDKGSISVEGYDPVKSRVDVLKVVSFIPQLPPPIKLSVSELLKFVERSTNTKIEKIVQHANMMELDLKKHLNKPFFKLSGGMKQKLLISIALAKKSRLLVFDEPTANLDPKSREHFYKLLSSINYEHSTIFVTHRIEEINGLVNRKVYIDLGKVVEDERI
ncbi:ABC transporter ATP-binding protein [Hydrogenimonas thermophila]|uniref:ABC transporter ATP-binding protein n=1 Tax=Hydrogenimonas thermophila TaxID=223786 RepID=UPI002936DE0C|nr:ABC transporter ATP-binding protein [Hydrogenimonas thermophila]WOE70808.1 ABC transporter ATP-binding protein [Hydrogenimonas thermophila]WOE73326.1 ABC transporter ATP-binding protein [Hydrogenimonas thermophila]